MLALADIFRALKQHMLEQMGKAGAPRALIARADIVSHGDGKGRRAMILGEQHAQTVFEYELVKNYIVRFCRGAGLRRGALCFCRRFGLLGCGGFGVGRPALVRLRLDRFGI